MVQATTPLFGVPLKRSGYSMADDSLVATPEQQAQTARLEQQFPGLSVQDLLNEVPSFMSQPRVDPQAPQQVPDNNRFVETDPKHTGAAGVARDVLGTLGDFLLTRLRMPAMYAPAQRERRLQQASAGFDQNPLEAINRVASVDFTTGSRLREQFIDNQRLQATQESTAEARDARLQLAQQAANDRTRSRAAAYLATLDKWEPKRRAEGYSGVRDQILRYGNANGLDLSGEIPAVYDPSAIEAITNGAVPVPVQRRLDVSTDNNIRSTETSEGNNVRSTTTSRDNSVRSTAASERNNIRTTTTSRDNSIRSTATSERNNRRSTTTSRGNNVRSTNTSNRNNIRSTNTRATEGLRRMINGRWYVWRNGRAVKE